VFGLAFSVANRTTVFVAGRALALPISLSFFIIQLSLLVPRGAVVSVIAIRAEADRPRGRVGFFQACSGPLERVLKMGETQIQIL
jgi:hypothetical protein